MAGRRALRTPPRATRTKQAISYVEISDDDDDAELSENESTTEAEDRPLALRSRPRRIIKKQAPRKHRIVESDSERSKPKKHKRPKPNTPKPHTPQSNSSTSFFEIEYTGRIPEWHTLPYHILVQIFEFATYPLYDDRTFQPLASGRWLLDVAYMCRAFAEPALTILYKSPPLVPMVQAHRLVDLLEETPKALAYSYRQKVKSLRIDVGQVAAYSLPGRGHLDLHGLVKDLPMLEDLEFYHQKDMSPYRSLDDNIKWTYPEALFEALEHIDPKADGSRGDKTAVVKLKSWRWSSRLAGKKWPLEKIPEMHAKTFFSSLSKVAFVNYQVSASKNEDDDMKDERILASALSALPNLKHLIFESSTLVNSDLLPLLPKSLRNLELINCWEIIAEDFATFLLTHGYHFRVLTLNHCQSLSLSFLPVLGSACPELQIFRMNLTYFNIHATYRDSEPQYKDLLLPTQIPVWPSKLQIIELTQLRKWETEAAEMFFQSLLDSAGELVDLRRLTIQAILNIGWRDRASFRDKWVGSLARVFKRVCKSPLPTSTKLPEAKPFSLPLHGHQEIRVEKRTLSRLANGESVPRPVVIIPSPNRKVSSESQPRRSARASARGLPSGGYAETSDHSDTEHSSFEYSETLAPEVRKRKPARYVGLERELAVLKDTAGADSPDSPLSPKSLGADCSGDDQTLNRGKPRQKEVIQGMCEVVEVRIDNLRPMENQFTADDFLGPPESDDEEWNSDNDEEGGYAW